MEDLPRSKEFWIVVAEGIQEPPAGAELTGAQRKAFEEVKLKDLKATNYLFQGIDKGILKTIAQKGTANMGFHEVKVSR